MFLLSDKFDYEQYIATLAISGTIRGSSKGKTVSEFLKDRRWMRKRYHLYKNMFQGIFLYI